MRAAVRAAGKLRKRRAAPTLIALLGDARVRDEAADALVAHGRPGPRLPARPADRRGRRSLRAASRSRAVLAPHRRQRRGERPRGEPARERAGAALPHDLRAQRSPQAAAVRPAIDPVRLRAALGFEMMLHCRTNQILAVAGRRPGVGGRGGAADGGSPAVGGDARAGNRTHLPDPLPAPSGNRLPQCALRPALERRHVARPRRRVPRARPRPRHAQDARSAARPDRIRSTSASFRS